MSMMDTYQMNNRKNIHDEVTNAVMNADEHSIVYDDIRNRRTSSVNAVSSTYTANQLNQYTSVNSGGSARSITHDNDGNLTWDGQEWAHSWDGENRLISSSNFTSGVLCEYAYDYQSRRISKTTLTPNPYSSLTTKYIWDGWNIAAEITIDHVNSATNVSYYTWGLDLSGTLQGTGGVGGLLSDTKVSSSVTNTYFAVGDANGNITEYVDNIGAAKAHYEYSAVGEITAQSGSIADDFIHRFSTKPLDKKTRLVQYEYRPYDAPSARFITRDPIGERGGNPLYGFVGNDGVNRLDKLGLFSIRPVAGSPRVRTNSDGSFGGMWASVVILPDDNSFPLSGVVLHMKHTEIHVTKCDGTPVADFVQTLQKRIPTDGSAGWPLKSGQNAPIYSNVAELKGYGKCVKGKILVKAVWYHFKDTAGLPPLGSPASDNITGSKDAEPTHGSVVATTGWPSISRYSYTDFGSLSIEISLNCSSPFYDIRADGRGLDSKHWASRKGRINDEEGSEAYDGWYN